VKKALLRSTLRMFFSGAMFALVIVTQPLLA
jgi:hypothetical protein